MKNGTFIVFKKELSRFFGDRRLLFTSVIMPGLMIYVIYSLMGSAMSSMINDKTSAFKAAADNMPQVIADTLKEQNFTIETVDPNDLDDIKEKIRSGDLAIYAHFPDNFEETLAAYGTGSIPEDTPNIEIYYNSADIGSSHAYSDIFAVLDQLEKNVSNVFDVNNVEDPADNPYDLATKEEASGTILSMILPLILMTLMFSSCVSLAPESIAGEKERGTIAALLITPVPRSNIILGKICALSVMALLGGLSSFLGTFVSIPKLMQNMGEETGGITTDFYKTADYVWLILLIISAVMLFVTIISIVSTLAKSVKEAGTLVMPLQIIVMMLSVTTMYSSEPRDSIVWFFIPLYNTILSMTEIFSFSATALHIIVTIAMNALCSAVGIFVLTKLFNDERVMFNSNS